MPLHILPISLCSVENKENLTRKEETSLNRAQRFGVRLLLASARPLPGLYRERDILDLASHGGLLMAYNGGLIAEAGSGRVLSSTAMDREAARQVLRALEELPVTPILDDGCVFYVVSAEGYKVQYECMNNNMRCVEVANLADAMDFAPCKILMSVQPDAIREVQKAIASLLPGDLTVVQTAPFYLEVIPAAVNKGVGLRAACAALDVAPEETIAFGDSENDIEMLRAAGVGVAMANADDAVKKAADMITSSNNENGIAVALERLLKL